MSQLPVTPDEGSAALNYEINLGCDACGHAQFLHCDSHVDPCGCLSMSRSSSVIPAGRVRRDCACPGFVRPPDAPVPPDAWWDHAHETKGESA